MEMKNRIPDIVENDLLRRLPRITRAREFHLYAENGRRLVDLWQLGGKAVLGHKPPRAVSEMKNAAERGLFSPFPHFAENRFIKALAKLFMIQDNHKYNFYIYKNESSLEKALANADLHINDVCIWRPFSQKEYYSTLYMPILPWALSPVVLAIRMPHDNPISKEFERSYMISPDDIIPPVILTPATISIYDLIAAGENGGRPVFSKLEKMLASTGNWQKNGIYLTCSQEIRNDYVIVWQKFLEQGFLLPPSPEEPLILPGSLSPGEEAKLAGLFNQPRMSTMDGADPE